jgi:hypothetical protein
MTDQFQFEPQDGIQDPDEGEPEGPVDRLEDPIDEGYAPAEPWSTRAAFGGSTRAAFGGQPVDETEEKPFEQRLEQEEPEVEDDWDEDLASDVVEGGADGDARGTEEGR